MTDELSDWRCRWCRRVLPVPSVRITHELRCPSNPQAATTRNPAS